MEDCLPPDAYRYVRTMPGCAHLIDEQIRELARHFYFTAIAGRKISVPKAEVAPIPKKKAS